MADPNDFNASIIEEFRANDGVVGGPFEGAPIVLLHTIGARTGTARVNPLVSQPVGDDVAVFASAAGSTKDPAWFRNLMAHPDTTVEIGTEVREVRARVAEGDERTKIWEKQKATMPGFAEYEVSAGDREIPVVVLERRN
jgi:deazaflavin-dependent oxidoreductase (nitroreductase family)